MHNQNPVCHVDWLIVCLLSGYLIPIIRGVLHHAYRNTHKEHIF